MSTHYGYEPFSATTQIWGQERINMIYDLLLHNLFKNLRQGR